MTLIGWIQILLFCAIVAALARPLGGYMTRVLDGEVRRPRRGRAAALPPCRHRPGRGAVLARLRARAARLQPRRLPRALRAAAAAGRAAAQPGRLAGRAAGARLQHRGQLRDQHQLADLWRRDHDEPPHPDGRADGAELRLGRHRHRGRRRADPRLRPRLDAGASAISGSISPGSRSTCCCRSRAVLALVLVAQGVPQTLAGAVDATTLEGARQTIAVGPVASQVAIKMLGTNGGGFFNANSAHPFENPTALANLLQMLVDLRDRRGAHLRLRPHGRRRAPGLGDPRRDGRCCSSPASRVAYWAEAAGNPLVHALGDRRRQHGGQGGPLRHRRCRRCSRSSPRRPPAARSTPCTTASPRSAA